MQQLFIDIRNTNADMYSALIIHFSELNSKNLLDDEELNLLKLYLALRGISFEQDEPEGERE